MKSKNKFTNNFSNNNLITLIKNYSNNFKHGKYVNPIIITLILGFSIYLLYFNDKIYVQDTITNSLNENNHENNHENSDQDYFIENFDVGKYVDVCKNRNTHIYNLGAGQPYSNKTITECEALCNDNSCNVFALNNSSCTTFKGTRTSTNPIKISCNSKPFSYSEYGAGTYNGIGYINKNYFQYNKTDISYIDPYLIESTNVLADLYSIEQNRNKIKDLDPLSPNYDASYHALTLETINKDKALYRKFDTLNRNIFDSSRNVLYTDMYNNSDISNTILAPLSRNNDFLEDIKKKYNMVKNSDNLDGVLDAKSENFMVNNIRYLILAFIMVMTIIILILYKFSIFINEKLLIAYIVIITFIVLIITHQLKL
jgi:hypothetical protein